MRPTTKTTTTTATAPPPHNSQLIQKCPGSSPSDVGSPIAPPFTLPPRCLKLSADSKVPWQLPPRPSVRRWPLPPSLPLRSSLLSPLSPLSSILSWPPAPPLRSNSCFKSGLAALLPTSVRPPSACSLVVCVCLLVSFLCFYPLRSGQTIPRASIETLLHQRVAAAYIYWLIAANGIASHLAASRVGMRLLLLLLLLALAGAATDVTPVLGRDALPAPGATIWPRDGRSVRQPRRWPRHEG